MNHYMHIIFEINLNSITIMKYRKEKQVKTDVNIITEEKM